MKNSNNLSLYDLLRGTILSIRLEEKGCWWFTPQCCDFENAVIEYSDKLIRIAHHTHAESDTILLTLCHEYDPQLYSVIILPKENETIKFERGVYSDCGLLERLEFCWNDTLLFITSVQEALVISRDVVPWGEESPLVGYEYPLV